MEIWQLVILPQISQICTDKTNTNLSNRTNTGTPINIPRIPHAFPKNITAKTTQKADKPVDFPRIFGPTIEKIVERTAKMQMKISWKR